MLRTLVEAWLRQQGREQLYVAAREALDGSSAAVEYDDAAPMPCDIGFVFALQIEAGGLVDKLPDAQIRRRAGRVEHVGVMDERRVVVIQSGVGRRAAAQATEHLIRTYQPSWVVSAGFGGGLVPDVRRGHVVMADEVVDMHGNRLSVGLRADRESVAAMPSLHIGRLLTVDHILRTRAAKLELGESHAALACDMETIAVAEACRQAEIGCLSVRVISDGLDDALPPEVEKLLDQQSWAGKLGAAAGAVFRRPSSVKDMWALQEQALKASDRLGRFLEGVVSQLSPPAQ